MNSQQCVEISLRQAFLFYNFYRFAEFLISIKGLKGELKMIPKNLKSIHIVFYKIDLRTYGLHRDHKLLCDLLKMMKMPKTKAKP